MPTSGKKRVFIISPTESVMTKRGNRHPQLAAMLHAVGVPVTYITADYYHGEKRRFTECELKGYRKQTPYNAELVSTVAYSVNTSVRRLLGNWMTAHGVRRILAAQSRKGDVVILSPRPPEIALAAVKEKKRRKFSILFDVNDVWPDGLPLGGNLVAACFRVYCNMLNRMLVGSGDAFTITAPRFRQWLAKYTQSDSAFVPLGFDTQRWEEHRPLSPDDVSGDLRLVYVGDLTTNNDLRPLLSVLGDFPRVHLTLIGATYGLDAMIKSCPHARPANLHTPGRKSPREVAQHLTESHVGVVPMKSSYAMPGKLFDYIGACRPIIVFGKNDSADLVRANDVGWVVPFASDATRAWLASLTHESIARKSERLLAVRERFSKEELYKQFLEIVQCMMRNRD